MTIRKGQDYMFPQEKWNKRRCAAAAKHVHLDGCGTALHFKGYIGCPTEPYGYGKTRFNGGCIHNGDWYEGQIRPLPKVAKGYVIVVIPTWGWRIREVNNTDTIPGENHA